MDSATEWWESFFPDLYLELQRHHGGAYVGDARQEAAFIARVLRVQPPARLLDVPCGAGRHALELASLGFGITGVDLTAGALEEARRHAAERHLALDWHRLDMRELPWTERFDGAYCFHGSFGYFNESGDRRFLAAAARALRPGARLLIDTHIAETLLPRFQARNWTRLGQHLLLEDRSYDHERGRVDTDWTLIGDDRVLQRTSSIRLYTYAELVRLLQGAGFWETEAYDTSTQLPFHFNAARLAIVAKRE
jgi:SAM-dependent methyltransferase